MKEFFTQLKTFHKWAFIAPWYNNTTSGISNIESTKDWSIDAQSVTSYFPRFINRKDQKNIKFDEYISINIGHSVDLSELILDWAHGYNRENMPYMWTCYRLKGKEKQVF